jgi:NAD(P)H dehydrogenase (quinone)
MEKILVTGATGQLGTEVIKLLLNKTEAKNISILARDPAKAEHFKSKGITIHQGNYNDYGSLVKAFKGINKLYFISTGDMTNRETQHENVVKAATEAEVKHIIYTSFQRKNDSDQSPISFVAKAHIVAEKAIKASGLTYTILKHGLYADFIPVILGNSVFETGTIYLPTGDGKVAFTSRADLAAGGVAVITGTGHENKTYEFYADTRYSFSDIASMLSKIKNRPISYVSLKSEEYVQTLTKAGVPTEYIGLFAGFSEAIKRGEFDNSDNTLSGWLGRKCTDLGDFLNILYKN